MGVGYENKDSFFSPYIEENDMQILEHQSGQSTDEEENLGALPHPTFRSKHSLQSRQRSASLEACLTGMYRRCGSRQARRTENIKSILNWRVIGLRQGDGDDDGDDDSLYNRCLHGLPALFADKDNMRVWHDFIRHSEQDQDRILNMQKDNSHLCEIEELPDDTVHDSAMEVTGSGVFRQR